MLILSSRRTVADAVSDYGCALVSSVASTYGSTVATNNTAAINLWAQRLFNGTERRNILSLGGGYIAVNGTLGYNTTLSVAGYNNDAVIRGLPSGAEIVGAGGYANGRYGVNYIYNKDTSGLMWVGDSTTPVIRLVGHGNKIDCNIYGYQYASSSSTIPSTRARAAIELYNIDGYSPCGKHDINGAITGFTKGIWCVESNHCDHLRSSRLMFRDCVTDIHSDNEQSKNHHFDMIEHWCPEGVQSTVFDYQKGGNMSADFVSMTGDYGVTLLRTDQAASAAGSYEIGYFDVDAAISNHTSGYYNHAGTLTTRTSDTAGVATVTSHFATTGALCNITWSGGARYNCDVTATTTTTVTFSGGKSIDQVGFTGAAIYADDNVITEGSNNPGGGMGVTVSNVNSGSFKRNIIANKVAAGTQFALSLQDGTGWETKGWGVRNFVVEDNVVYNWRGVNWIRQPTEAEPGQPLPVMENIDFINNIFQEPVSEGDRLIDTYTASVSVNSFSGGKYFTSEAASDWFSLAGDFTTSFAEWQAAVEANAVSLLVDFFDPNRTCDTYAVANGYADWAARITAVTADHAPHSFDGSLTDAVNDYIRAGFNIVRVTLVRVGIVGTRLFMVEV